MTGKLFQVIDSDKELIGLYWFWDDKLTTEQAEKFYKEFRDNDIEWNGEFDEWMLENYPAEKCQRVYVEYIQIN